MSYNVGVVGATGVVGKTFIQLLKTRNFPVNNLKLFASESSKGCKVDFNGKPVEIDTLNNNCFKGLDVVFFSSGDEVSKEWAPQAAASGAFAIDNSAAFRMNPQNLLCVPEVNGDKIPDKSKPQVIANPNCSTIQLVVALNALKDFELEDVKVATYQSVSGAGKAGIEELKNQTQMFIENKSPESPKSFPHPIAFNCLPHIGSFNQDGFCSEEVKIMNETKKILNNDSLKVSAFTVRIPSLNCHSEAVWLKLKLKVSRSDIEAKFNNSTGITYVPQNNPQDYPTALSADNKDPVYVGRLHQDTSDPHTWIFWVVADNLLKGAALNGIQIAEKLFAIDR